MFIDEIAKTYLVSKDEVLKLLEADGIEPIFGMPFGDAGYITSKQFELVKSDFLKIQNRCLQDSVDYYQKKSTKKEAYRN